MPVYQQTYSHYTGEYRPRGLAWTVIAWKGIRKLVKAKGFRISMIFSFAVFLVLTVQLYLNANKAMLELFQVPNELTRYLVVNEELFFNFLNSQKFFCFLLPVIFCCDLIAGDKRTKALALYLSKPISKLDYLFGKGAIILSMLYIITIVQALLLMILHASFTENWGYLIDHIPLAVRIILYSNMIGLPILISVLTLSSLVKSRIAAATMFCVLYFVPYAIANILRELFYAPMFSTLFSQEWWSLLSFQTLWLQLGAVMFKQDIPYDLHWGYHLAALIVFCVLASMLLWRQIRAVEVVK